MKLSAYLYVVVKVACPKCGRNGAYRLARLAAKYGSEIEMPYLIAQIAADCPRRATKRVNIYDRCEAFFPEMHISRPPDGPPTSKAALRVVG